MPNIAHVWQLVGIMTLFFLPFTMVAVIAIVEWRVNRYDRVLARRAEDLRRRKKKGRKEGSGRTGEEEQDAAGVDMTPPIIQEGESPAAA